jgi:hypothetical protein
MDRYSSGLDPDIIRQREKNKLRILKVIIKAIDEKRTKSTRFTFYYFKIEVILLGLARGY